MRSGNSNYWDYIENYWFLINYNVTHIRHSELKASIIITAYGVVFGLAYDVGSSLMIADKYKYIFYTLLGAFVVCAITSMIFSFRTFIPRINVKLRKSVFFFNDAKYHFKSAKKYTKSLRDTMLNDEDLVELLGEQAYVNGVIAAEKYANISKAIKFMMYSVFTAISAILTEFIL